MSTAKPGPITFADPHHPETTLRLTATLVHGEAWREATEADLEAAGYVALKPVAQGSPLPHKPDFQLVRDCINQAIGEVHGPDVDALIDGLLELTLIVEELSGRTHPAYYQERARLATASKP